ncbi:DUF2442 domain-containing protein [Methylobacterium sp. WL122]|nr:DUF2442 domain-containing protein [Methylobacterium sp. WL122]
MKRNSVSAAVLSELQALDNFTLSVRWSDGPRSGSTDLIDISDIVKKYKIYLPLRKDPPKFKQAYLINGGRVVAWGDDAEIDITTDDLLSLAESKPHSATASARQNMKFATYKNVFSNNEPIFISEARMKAEPFGSPITTVASILPKSLGNRVLIAANDLSSVRRPSLMEVAI